MNVTVAPQTSVDASGTSVLPDRRRLPRYRFSTPITLRIPGGGTAPAITMEISESGLSALVGAAFHVGDRLEVEPVGGGKAEAIVRRSMGRLYGFEFLNLSPGQVQNIRERCKKLPLHMGGPAGV